MTKDVTGRVPLPECPEGVWPDESGWAIIHIDTLEDFFALFRPGCTVAAFDTWRANWLMGRASRRPATMSCRPRGRTIALPR